MRACVPLLVAAALAAGAAHGEMILLAPQEEVAGGGSVRIDLLITNEDAGARSYRVPERLRLRLSTHDAAFNVTLDPDAGAPHGEIELQAGTFRRIVYRGQLPEALSGNVSVQAQDLDAAPLTFAVAPGARVAEASKAIAAETTGAAHDVPSGHPSGAAGLDPAGTFFSALSPYEPVYAVVGEREGWNAKFQLSLKFRFFPRDAPVVKHLDFLQDLYLGYTQTSLWDLESASKPFFDSSYKPRLFFFDPNVWRLDPQMVAGIEGGVGHESNGRGETESRSINIAYIKPILTLGPPGGWQWTIAPMLYDYLDKEENPDIAEYRGYVDLYAAVGKAGKWKLAGTFRRGTGVGWSTQLDLSYPLRSVALGNLNGYILFQYFDGWGESLLAYNQRLPAQYRLGLAVVR